MANKSRSFNIIYDINNKKKKYHRGYILRVYAVPQYTFLIT